MAFNRKLYPREWDEMRASALERAGYRCESCGILDTTDVVNPRKPHPFHPDGTPYRVRLQLAHKRQYQTWNREADTMVLCPRCHRRYDAQFRRKGTSKRFSPVGLVLVWIPYQGKPTLAADVCSFSDLFEFLASLPVGTAFDLQLEMFMCRVGFGCYLRERNGITVLREEGACESFGVFLQEVLQGVVI